MDLNGQPEDVQKQWLAEADGFVLFSHSHVDGEFLDGCPNLGIIFTPSVGFDSIDAVECAKRGVWVTNGAGSITETTADLALCLMLGASRHLGSNHMEMKMDPAASSSNWFGGPEGLGDDLTNKTLGVCGFGRIGQNLAQKCRVAFNMRILYYDAFHVQHGVTGAEQVSFEELLRESDFISINSVLDESSYHLFGAEEFAMMKKGSYLINAARGPLVDEEALAEALTSGHLGGAGLDVYEIEPPAFKEDGTTGPCDALRNAPNVFLQPHIGSATTAARQEQQFLAVRNIRAVFVEGRGPLTPVNSPLNPKL